MFERLFGARGVEIESDKVDIIGRVDFAPGVGKEVRVNGARVLTTDDDIGGQVYFTGVCTVSLQGVDVVLGGVTVGGVTVDADAIPFSFVRIGKMCFLHIPTITCSVSSGSAGAILLDSFSPDLPSTQRFFAPIVPVFGSPPVVPQIITSSNFSNTSGTEARLLMYGDTNGFTSQIFCLSTVCTYVTNQ